MNIMPNFLSIILTILLISSVLCDITYNYGHPSHPGKCFYEGIVLSPGVHKNPAPNTCLQLECQPDGWATIKICPFRRPATKCRFEGYVDRTRKYPQCCEKIEKCI